MSWLSSFGSSLLGGVLGKGIDTASSSYMLNQQLKAQEELYKNRYQWTVQDMEAAGLNPILAATSGGFGVSSASVGSPSSPSGTDISSSAAQLAAIKVQEKQADAALTNAKTNQQNANTALTAVTQQGRQIDALINLYGKQGAFFDTSSALNVQQTEKVKQDIANSIAIVNGQLQLFKAQEAEAYAGAGQKAAYAAEAYKHIDKMAGEIENMAHLNGLYDISADQIKQDMRITYATARPDLREEAMNNSASQWIFKAGVVGRSALGITQNINNIGKAVK